MLVPPPFHARLAIVLSAVLATAGSAHAADVTIYRCSDASGHLTLRDTPCAKGQRQQTRDMLRPRDPPPGSQPARAAPPPVTATPAPAYRVIVINPPRPVYECIDSNGDRYTSDSAEGRPRWVPLWTIGYPGYLDGGSYRGSSSGYGGRLAYRHGAVSGQLQFGRREGAHFPAQPMYRPGINTDAGTWVRDACQPLPQAEVCDRLRDRRHELDRRYNSALQSERSAITDEERGIDARLTNDCGVH